MKDNIPKEYLDQLAISPAVLNQLPLSVRQKVWHKYPAVFAEFVASIPGLLRFSENYWKDWSLNFGCEEFDFVGCETRRASNSGLQLLNESIGDSVELYKIACDVIREFYKHSANPLYSLLRMDLLMTMHDSNKREVFLQQFR
jgi:hypothetical protein